MSSFRLEVISPDREVFNENVESVTVTSKNGQITVLPGHAPMVASLDVGTMRVKNGNEVIEAFHSEGFMEVRPDEVIMFVQACEKADEIDAIRAEEARQRAAEKLRQKQSYYEHRHTSISLARAMARLKISQKK